MAESGKKGPSLPLDRCTCVDGRIGLCGACLEHLMHGGPKPLPPFGDAESGS